jgi:hypothetical protein
MAVITERVGIGLTRRLRTGRATVTDIGLAAWVLGSRPLDLLPVSFDDLGALCEDLVG